MTTAEQSIQFDDLSPLLAALCDGTLDDDGFAHLERLLDTNSTVRQWYIAYMDLHGELCWDHRKNDECGMMNDELPEQTRIPADLGTIAPTDPSSFILLHPSFRSPLSSLPSLLFSYLLAAMILGAGLLIAAVWKMPENTQIAQQFTLPSPLGRRAGGESSESGGSPLSSLPSTVGRITGMVDCKWKNDECGMMNDELRTDRNGIHHSSFIIHHSPVHLGDKFALASGLLEITYDTGAKVILQGPVTYEVESPAGGFLSLGKLTAKLEKRNNLPSPSGRGAGGEGGSPSIHHSSLITHHSSDPSSLSTIHSPLFTIKTPTAVVTDLGTEFGVEVRQSGVTFAHVYRGAVNVQANAAARFLGESVRLTINESVEVASIGADEAPSVQRVTNRSPAFVRTDEFSRLVGQQKSKAFQRWQDYTDKLHRDSALVVHYDFQRRDDSPNILHGAGKSSDRSFDGVIEGAAWTTGHIPGKHALDFDGDQARVKISLPHELRQVTIAARVAIVTINESCPSCCLLADDWANDFCKGVLQITPGGQVQLARLQTPAVLPWQDRGTNRWRHVAMIIDPPHERGACYLDGKKVYEDVVAKDCVISFRSAHIGNWWGNNSKYERGLCGRMDELVILARPMTDKEIAEMYEAGGAATQSMSQQKRTTPGSRPSP